MRILIVEDDPSISRLVKETFEDAGHDVLTATDGKSGEQLYTTVPIDAAIIDIMLPGLDGRELCRRIKSTIDVPVILLTALDEWGDKRQGFEHGADDYMTKPFIPEEILFRLQAVSRRYRRSAASHIQAGPLQLDLREYEVTLDGQLFYLPKKEFELLFQLASFPGRVYRREELIDLVWGFDFEGDERTVDVHIKRLRHRFNHPAISIRTVRGVGYSLEVNG
ncbi:response regulator transcription factor [Exiguobacterium qingdaonense]|uniref:response regulator transcription factor n=1 Tax=Exiguobacterium qingdaonense TaxID=2751251 RepID=UPI001BE94040|nr:response regulator transcription factor [Exiguobacterium qingdaonense]